MEYKEIFHLIVSMLSSIITGGFVLVFVEIGNRKNRENDRYDVLMNPFMHKLSAYFRFVSWFMHNIIYPDDLNDKEKEFKKLVEKIGKNGWKAIMSGGDYPIDSFTPESLQEIANEINNIWYWHDKMKPCRLIWKEDNIGKDDFLAKELSEINPTYLSMPYNVNLLSKVSGDFFVDIYQPIEYETYKHMAYIKHYRRQTVFVLFAVFIVLLILSLLLFLQMPVILMQLSTLFVVLLLFVSLLILGFDIKTQIIWFNRINMCFQKLTKNKK